MYIFQIVFHHRWLQDIEYSSLCYIVNPCCLAILYTQCFLSINPILLGFPDGSVGKESTCNIGDPGSIPGLGRSPGEGKGYPLQYSDLENPMGSIVPGVTKSWTRLSSFQESRAPNLSLSTPFPLWEPWACFMSVYSFWKY